MIRVEGLSLGTKDVRHEGRQRRRDEKHQRRETSARQGRETSVVRDEGIQGRCTSGTKYFSGTMGVISMSDGDDQGRRRSGTRDATSGTMEVKDEGRQD